MKILVVSIFVFIFVGVLSALGAVTLFGERLDTTISVNATTMQATFTNLSSELSTWNHTGSSSYYDVSIWSVGGLVIDGFNSLLKATSFAMGTGGYLQSIFPIIPSEFIGLISAVIILIAIVGFVFWIANRSGWWIP